MEESRRWRVDRTREEHKSVSENISGEPKNSCYVSQIWNMIPQHLRTVCPSTPVCSKLIPADPSAQTMICNWNVISHEIVYQRLGLYLVVPPVRAGSNLFSPLKVVCPTKKVGTQVRQTLGRCVIKTHHKQGTVNNIETAGVVSILLKHLPQSGPYFAILCWKNTNCLTSNLWAIKSVGIGNNSLKVAQDFALGKEREAIVVWDIKPIWVTLSTQLCIKECLSDPQNWPRRRMTMCLESEYTFILQPLSVGIRAAPKSRVYWSISSGMPRAVSGSRLPVWRSWMKPRDETMSDAARGSWEPRSGAGSFLIRS